MLTPKLQALFALMGLTSGTAVAPVAAPTLKSGDEPTYDTSGTMVFTPKVANANGMLTFAFYYNTACTNTAASLACVNLTVAIGGAALTNTTVCSVAMDKVGTSGANAATLSWESGASLTKTS